MDEERIADQLALIATQLGEITKILGSIDKRLTPKPPAKTGPARLIDLSNLED